MTLRPMAIKVFGQFDGDGSGFIEFGEFKGLWEHLGGDEGYALRATFEKYDRDSDGRMTESEVHAMMTDIGYTINGDYLTGVLELFGKFDGDGSGFIEFKEFQGLWEHLGGES